METAVREQAYQSGASEVLPEEIVAELGEKKLYLFSKRVFDIIVALFGLIVLLIPMVLICILVKLDSAGPALFAQKRMGKDGNVFVIYKFRTMKITAPKELASRDFRESAQYVTSIGAILRRTSIDELPQLYNVLRGDMSLVGYRPVCLSEVKLNEMRKQCGVFAMCPGITGLAQVKGRDNVAPEEKVHMDLEYVKNCGWALDLWCLKETAATVISGRGVN